MKKSLLLLAVGLLSSLSLVRAGDVTGVITLKGTPPPAAVYDLIKSDEICSTLYSDKLPVTTFFVVSSKGGLADVVVTLKDADGKEITGKSTGAAAAPAVLDQKGCLYVPQILAVQTGQKVIVKNSDPCVHNVHTKPAANEERNEAQGPGAPDLTFSFDKPEPFLKFQCDSHQWMFAWVTVVDSPYYSLSDKDGKFTIKNVPPGKYTLQIAHRKLGTQTAEIEVKDAAVTKDFTLEVK